MTSYDPSADRRDLTSIGSAADLRSRLSLPEADVERVRSTHVHHGGTGSLARHERWEAVGVDLRASDLRAFLDLSELALPGLQLNRANAPNLRLGHVRELTAEGANLPNLNADGADLSAGWFVSAYLRNASLRDANLVGARMREADLRGADLRNADLRGADLRGADLRGACLEGARLDEAQLRSATFRFGPESPKLDVLALLRADWRVPLSGTITRDLMLFDAATHPSPTAFDHWAEDGQCPYDGRERVLRPIGFGEASHAWEDGLGAKAEGAWDRTGIERAPDGVVGGARYLCPQPLPLLLRLLCEVCVVEDEEGERCGPNQEGLDRALRALWRATRRFRVDVTRVVDLSGSRTYTATVEVDAADEDEARSMVEEDPDDFSPDWTSDYDDEIEEDGVDRTEVEDVSEV